MTVKISLTKNQIRALLIAVGIGSLGNVYYQLGVAPNWQWGPALDKMPKHVVNDFHALMYKDGKAQAAKANFISDKAKVDYNLFPEFDPSKKVTSRLLRPAMGDGRQVTVVHELQYDDVIQVVVDVIDIGARGGRIDSIQRHIVQ